MLITLETLTPASFVATRGKEKKQGVRVHTRAAAPPATASLRGQIKLTSLAEASGVSGGEAAPLVNLYECVVRRVQAVAVALGGGDGGRG